MKSLNLKCIKILLSGLVCLLFGFGCAPQNSQAIQLASQNVTDSLGCTNVKSKIFDAFYELVDQRKVIPDPEQFKYELDQKIDQIILNKTIQSESKQIQTLEIQNLKQQLHLVVDSLLSQAKKDSSLTPQKLVQKLIEYELEDQSDANNLRIVQTLHTSEQQIKKLSQSLQLDCSNNNVSNPVSQFPASGSDSETRFKLGTKKVFSTAYQSCRVLDLPELDSAVADISGIRIVGKHPDGIGSKREIADLKAVDNTHYYIRGIATESQCADVKRNPLIYDYGGEPAISKNVINFQVNAGTGTQVLGVDCSAYVSSIIAVSGMLYKPGVENKAIFIRQTSSKFINAAQSGFTCFDNVTVTPTESVKAGDIIGVKGHVVAIDQIGSDPFGLKLIKNISECSKLNYKNFDMVITQSSPSKNGIGINRYQVKDYLDESGPNGKMTTAFVSMGQQACLAKFQNKNMKPNNSEWGFLRHKGTPECVAPRVTMVGESCTKKCF